MSMRPTAAALVLLAAMISACAGVPRPRDAAATPSNAPATVAVPNARGALADGLERRLQAHGWTLIGYNPAALRRARSYSRLAAEARYRLTLTRRRIGDCRNGEAGYRYNLAVIENASGKVALALTGAQCLSDALDAFDADLRRQGLVTPGAQQGAAGTPE